jgi:hypothetical protein
MSFGENIPDVSKLTEIEIPEEVPPAYKSLMEFCFNNETTGKKQKETEKETKRTSNKQANK